MSLPLRASTRFGPRLVPRRQLRGLANHQSKGQQVAVIGGGLTGLTATYYLAKHLPSSAHITLYEAGDRLGGWIRTDKVPVNVNGTKGVVSFERGPRTFSSLYGNTWRYDDLVLYDLMLDLGLKPSYPKDLPRRVYYPDHLVTMPPDADIFSVLSEPLFRECLWDVLGAAAFKLLGTKAPKKDYSIADWLRIITFNGSGRVANNLASAMIHGIYGGDINRLSARSVLERMYFGYYLPSKPGHRNVPRHEEVFMKYMSEDKMICAEAKKPKGSLIHFGAHGLEALPKALEHAIAEQPNVTIRRQSPVTDVSMLSKDDKVQVAVKGLPKLYDNVLSTTSSDQLVKSTGDTLSILSGIESVSIMTVNLWYPQQDLKPPGFGYLIPRSVPDEQNPERALGVFFDSDVISERGPDEPPGTKLFVLMGGHYYRDRAPPSEDEAVAQAKAVVERHLGIPSSTPCHAMARLAKDCIPQHDVGHADLLRLADKQLISEFKGRLTVASGSYGRVGALGALRNGHDAAHMIAEDSRSSGLFDYISEHHFVQVPTSMIPCRPEKKA